jgi:hypothetical protein
MPDLLTEFWMQNPRCAVKPSGVLSLFASRMLVFRVTDRNRFGFDKIVMEG